MSALRRIQKVKGGYEVTVSCSNKPTLTAFYRTYEQCGKFAYDYFLDYLGVALKSVHHPEGDGEEPDGVNPDSLETIEIEIPMNERLKELAVQAGMEWDTHIWCWLANPPHLEKFAELIRADERKGCAEHYLGIMRDAVEAARLEEREACAKLCESCHWEMMPTEVAQSIRARGEK